MNKGDGITTFNNLHLNAQTPAVRRFSLRHTLNDDRITTYSGQLGRRRRNEVTCVNQDRITTFFRRWISSVSNLSPYTSGVSLLRRVSQVCESGHNQDIFTNVVIPSRNLLADSSMNHGR
jgi:hypothetical protein